MKEMTLEKIAAAVRGTLFLPHGEDAKKEISGVVIDNRQIEKDGLFIAIKGERADGHDFIPEAFADGAAAVFSAKELNAPAGPYILVENTEAALKDLAMYYRSTLSIPVIGIIGSVGKTSTKEMTAAVLSESFSVLKTEGNFNNEIGLPLTLLRIREEHEAAVVEMGISDFGEMDRLGRMAKPNMVIMTNIGQCHLENLKTRDGILKAKTEVFAHLTKPAAVILNGDDDKLSTVHDLPETEIFFYGRGEKASVKIKESAAQGLSGVHAVIETPAGELSADIPLPGEHNVYNAAAAAAAGLYLKMPLAKIKDGIEHVETIRGRNRFVEANGYTVIDDCYNANPQSMKASLSVLSQAKGRKIAVLGDMGELGADEKALHFEVGQAVKANGIDMLFACGELSKELCRGAAAEAVETAADAAGAAGEAGMTDAAGAAGAGRKSVEIRHFETKDALTEALQTELRTGDTVLVKASHFMDFSTIVQAITA